MACWHARCPGTGPFPCHRALGQLFISRMGHGPASASSSVGPLPLRRDIRILLSGPRTGVNCFVRFGVSGVEHLLVHPLGPWRCLRCATTAHCGADRQCEHRPVTGRAPTRPPRHGQELKPGVPGPPALLTSWLQIRGVPMTPRVKNSVGGLRIQRDATLLTLL